MLSKEKAALAASSGDATCEKNLQSLSESIDLAQQFTAAVGILASNRGYRSVAELIDEIPRLRDAAEERNRQVESLHKKTQELEEENDRASRRLVKIYEKEYDQFKDEKLELVSKLETLEKKIDVQDQDITRLMASESELKEKGRQVKGMWTAEKENLSKALKRVHELEEEVKRTATENSRFGNSLKQAQTEVSVTRRSLQICEDRASGLEQELRKKSESLDELKTLGVQLTGETWEKP